MKSNWVSSRDGMDWLTQSFGVNSTLSSVWARSCSFMHLEIGKDEGKSSPHYSFAHFVELYPHTMYSIKRLLLKTSLDASECLRILLRISEAANDQASAWGKVARPIFVFSKEMPELAQIVNIEDLNLMVRRCSTGW